MANKEKSESKSTMLKNVLCLFIVTLVAVFLLAVVYQITKEPIEAAEEQAKADVYAAVFVDATGFNELDGADDYITQSADILAENDITTCTIDETLVAVDDSGETLGYVIAATSSSGYGGDIQIAIGVSLDGTITGFDVISNSETAGLGAKSTEDEFTDQFDGLSANSLISFTKTGATADNEIDAISGATITTTAVTEAVNSAIIFYQTYLA